MTSKDPTPDSLGIILGEYDDSHDNILCESLGVGLGDLDLSDERAGRTTNIPNQLNMSRTDRKRHKQRSKRQRKRKENCDIRASTVKALRDDEQKRDPSDEQASMETKSTDDNKHNAEVSLKRKRHKPNQHERSMNFLCRLLKNENRDESDPVAFKTIAELLCENEKLKERKFNDIEEMQCYQVSLDEEIQTLYKHKRFWRIDFDSLKPQDSRPFYEPDHLRSITDMLQRRITALTKLIDAMTRRIETCRHHYSEYKHCRDLWQDQTRVPENLELLARSGESVFSQPETLRKWHEDVRQTAKKFAGQTTLKEILAKRDESLYMYRVSLGIYRAGVTGVGGRDMRDIEVNVQCRRYEKAIDLTTQAWLPYSDIITSRTPGRIYSNLYS